MIYKWKLTYSPVQFFTLFSCLLPMEVDLSCSQPSSCPVICSKLMVITIMHEVSTCCLKTKRWSWQITFLLVRRWMQYELQTLPFSKIQLQIPCLIYFGIKAVVLCICKLKRKILQAITHMSTTYFSFFIIWTTCRQLVTCARTRISIWPDCALLIYSEYHLLT